LEPGCDFLVVHIVGRWELSAKDMGASAIRNWLGPYMLGLTFLVAGYFFLAPADILALGDGDKHAAGEILVPFFVGQLTLIYQYYGDNPPRDAPTNIPKWAVMGPLVLVTILFVAIVVLMAVGQQTNHKDLIPAPEPLKGVLTAIVTILNATSAYIITRVFKKKRDG
jgi:hypothetical protein